MYFDYLCRSSPAPLYFPSLFGQSSTSWHTHKSLTCCRGMGRDPLTMHQRSLLHNKSKKESFPTNAEKGISPINLLNRVSRRCFRSVPTVIGAYPLFRRDRPIPIQCSVVLFRYCSTPAFEGCSSDQSL